MAQSCQFWGITSVLQAYDMRDVGPWAICHGKQFISKGDDRADLSSFLELLSNGYSNAVYTLKVYDGLSVDEIKDNTPCDGSFNFSLQSTGAVAGYNGGGNNDILLGRIASLEKKLADAEKRDETPSIGSVIMGWLENPEPFIQLIQGFKMLTGAPVAAQVAGVEPKHRVPVSGMHQEPPYYPSGPVQSAPVVVQDDETRQARLIAALNILEANDPDILDHLEQLADMSQNNKPFFQGLLKMLPKK